MNCVARSELVWHMNIDRVSDSLTLHNVRMLYLTGWRSDSARYHWLWVCTHRDLDYSIYEWLRVRDNTYKTSPIQAYRWVRNTKTDTTEYTVLYVCWLFHSGGVITRGGYSVQMSAEVGLLTRNIRIIGEDYPNLIAQSYGARVLIGKYRHDGTEYTGMYDSQPPTCLILCNYS